MIKFRILTLMTLGLSILGLNYGMEAVYAIEQISANTFYITHLGVFALSFLSVVASILMFLLSFFALETNSDGAFIIKRSSTYGRLFTRLIKTKRWSNLSFCETFWKTNLSIFIACFTLAVLGTLGIVLYVNAQQLGLWTLLLYIAIGIGAIIGFFVGVGSIIFGIITGMEKIGESSFGNRIRNSGVAESIKRNRETFEWIYTGIFVAAILALISMLTYRGLQEPWFIPIFGTLIGAAFLVSFTVLIWKEWLKETQFGITLK